MCFIEALAVAHTHVSSSSYDTHVSSSSYDTHETCNEIEALAVAHHLVAPRVGTQHPAVMSGGGYMHVKRHAARMHAAPCRIGMYLFLNVDLNDYFRRF